MNEIKYSKYKTRHKIEILNIIQKLKSELKSELKSSKIDQITGKQPQQFKLLFQFSRQQKFSVFLIPAFAHF